MKPWLVGGHLDPSSVQILVAVANTTARTEEIAECMASASYYFSMASALEWVSLAGVPILTLEAIRSHLLDIYDSFTDGIAIRSQQ